MQSYFFFDSGKSRKKMVYLLDSYK